jgi:hypothetical protein
MAGNEDIGHLEVGYKKALVIQPAERDLNLGLDRLRWPVKTKTPDHWEPKGSYLRRTISETPEEEEVHGAQLGCVLEEKVLRFPSAPIHGLHRIHEYHLNEGESENMHTFRVLSHPEAGKTRRVFLMHNGLNETQKMGLYYQLASHLIDQDETKGTVCILRPFPGHLTRSRFNDFAETPLDHYLWDGSHLFRQFLRFMIETQWLLSVIARRSSYRCISGLNLLAESDTKETSRLDDKTLAAAMETKWKQLHAASAREIPQLHGEEGDAAELRSEKDPPQFLPAIRSLRQVLGLKKKLGGDLEEGDEGLEIHAIGYSLGGFTAQSVFMSWPFLVSSCSTLLSGGPLRELAPTAFADPEEWQTVLHSLRYELDERMMNGLYRPRKKLVAGIELDLFLYLKSTFYEVFQQEFRGSFQTRLKAFRRRMLFVVGGNDPIVRPDRVLDSGPPDGMNMISVGGLGHFLGNRAIDDEENAQRSFWLPRLGEVIGKLADEASKCQKEERPKNWLEPGMRVPVRAEPLTPNNGNGGRRPKRLDIAERLAVDSDGKLPGLLFERCLDDLLVRVEAKRGVLFILRNEVPTVLLQEEAMRQHAAVLHHDDGRIVRYIEGLRLRKQLIEGNPERISIILPWNVKRITKEIDAPPGHPSQSEGGGGQMPKQSRVTPSQTWTSFRKWAESTGSSAPDALRIYDGRLGIDQGLPRLDFGFLEDKTRTRLRLGPGQPLKTSLPDCWIWMSPKFLLHDDEEPLDSDIGRRELCKVLPDRYLEDDSRLISALRKDHVRIVTVSRARYNPRFRGRLIADPVAARDLLHHATTCIAGSVPFPNYDVEKRRLRS